MYDEKCIDAFDELPIPLETFKKYMYFHKKLINSMDEKNTLLFSFNIYSRII